MQQAPNADVAYSYHIKVPDREDVAGPAGGQHAYTWYLCVTPIRGVQRKLRVQYVYMLHTGSQKSMTVAVNSGHSNLSL